MEPEALKRNLEKILENLRFSSGSNYYAASAVARRVRLTDLTILAEGLNLDFTGRVEECEPEALDDFRLYLHEILKSQKLNSINFNLLPEGNMPNLDDWVVLIEETGLRKSGGDRDHFVPVAAFYREANKGNAENLLEAFRKVTRKADNNLSWKDINSHAERVVSSQLLGASAEWLATTSVVLCHHTNLKRFETSEHKSYESVLLWLLQRVAWYIRDSGSGTGKLTIANITRYSREQLGNLLKKLRREYTELNYLDVNFRLIKASEEPLLLIPDRIAGTINSALEKNRGVSESRYLLELYDLFYRRCKHPSKDLCKLECLNTYGLGIWPKGGHTQLLRASTCTCYTSRKEDFEKVMEGANQRSSNQNNGTKKEKLKNFNLPATSGEHTALGANFKNTTTEGQEIMTHATSDTDHSSGIVKADKHPDENRILGTAALLLKGRGNESAATLLKNSTISIEYVEGDWHSQEQTEDAVIKLSFTCQAFAKLSDEIESMIFDALKVVLGGQGYYAQQFNTYPELMSEGLDWRNEIENGSAEKPLF